MEKQVELGVEITNRQSNWQIVKDLSSNFVGALSGNMFAYGLGLMLLDQTHLALSFGIDMIVTPLVGLACLVPVGNLVDRHRHKLILNCSISVRLLALLIFALTIDLFHGMAKLLPVILFLIVNAFSVNVSNSAYMASVHELVNNGKIQKLSSLVQAAASLALILSPAVGTALYSATNFDTFIYVEIGATLITALILQTMHFHYAPVEQKSVRGERTVQSQWQGFMEGLSYMKGRGLLKGMITAAVVINFIFTSETIGLPFVIKEQLNFGNGPVGFLNSAFSLGMLVGSVALSIFSKSNNLKTRLLIPLVILGFEFGLLGLTLMWVKNPSQLDLFGSIITAAFGITLTIVNITCGVRIQQTVPTKLLGRVSSLLMMAVTIVDPLGTLFYTFIFQNTSSGSVIFVINGIVMLAYIVFMTPLFLKWIGAEEKFMSEE